MKLLCHFLTKIQRTLIPLFKVQIGSSELLPHFAAGLPYFLGQTSTLFQSLGHLMEIRIPPFLKRVFLEIKSLLMTKNLTHFGMKGYIKLL